MIKGRNIICVASRWDYDPTSKHQIMKVLARNNHIVWVDYHGSRKPKLNLGDMRAAWSVCKRAARGVLQPREHITQITPLVVPQAKTRLAQSINKALVVSRVERVLKSLPQRPVQIWSFAPDAWFLAGCFNEERFVYYITDDFKTFEGFDPRWVAQGEKRSIEAADIVVASAQTLFEEYRDGGANGRTHLVRHGVDRAHFASALNGDIEEAPDLESIPRPRFGFFGLIHHWIDIKLIADVARIRPNYQFILLGDRRVDTNILHKLSNVHILGRRPYEELPAYCRGFDVGLMPFTRAELAQHINPIKLREYLAAGLPVVSTPLPEAARYDRDVLMADDAKSFADCCDKALTMNARPLRLARSEAMKAESWDYVVGHLCEIVQKGYVHPAPTPKPNDATPAHLGIAV
jgi:glycosyltransferase involved in cell wall biosynthesis